MQHALDMLAEWNTVEEVSALDRIVARGFKSIASMDLKLGPINLLIGANGSGKSNFVGLLGMLNRIVRGELQPFVQRSGGPDALLHFGQKVTDSLHIHLEFGQNEYEVELVPSEDASLYIAHESCAFQGRGFEKPFTVPLARATRESGLRDEASGRPNGIADHVLRSITSWRIYHFHDTSSSAAVKQPASIGDNQLLRANAANLAPFLLRLRDTQRPHYNRIVQAVRLIAPFFGDFFLRPNPFNEEQIKLEWTESGSEAVFGPNALSDGTLRFICLATLLLQPSPPTTIVVDEPELGLHPAAIEILAAMLRSSSQSTQVIVSTQSVTLVNKFAPEDVVVVERTDDGSTFRRLGDPEEMKDWLDDYGLGDLWEKNLLGGRPGPSRPTKQ